MENPLDEHLTKDPVVEKKKYPPITIQFIGNWLFYLIGIIVCIVGAQSLLGFVYLSIYFWFSSSYVYRVAISGYAIITSVIILHFILPVFHIQREYFERELRESVTFATAIFAIPLGLIIFFLFFFLLGIVPVFSIVAIFIPLLNIGWITYYITKPKKQPYYIGLVLINLLSIFILNVFISFWF